MESITTIKSLLTEKYNFPKKGKLFRKDAARLFKSLMSNEKDNENNEVFKDVNSNKQVPLKKNVARRGKPLRLGLRVQRLIDNETLSEKSESVRELVLDRNFCRLLMRYKHIPSDVHSFLEERLSYINYNLNKYF